MGQKCAPKFMSWRDLFALSYLCTGVTCIVYLSLKQCLLISHLCSRCVCVCVCVFPWNLRALQTRKKCYATNYTRVRIYVAILRIICMHWIFFCQRKWGLHSLLTIAVRCQRYTLSMDLGGNKFSIYLTVIRLCKTKGHIIRLVCWRMSHYRV